MSGEVRSLTAAMTSLGEWNGFPFELVPRPAFESIAGQLARIPPVSSAAGFEVRLDAANPRVDFATLIVGGTDDVERVARLGSAGSGHDEFLAEKAWQRLAELGRRWREPPLRDALSSVILEFDALPSEESIPIPSIFVRLAVDSEPAARLGAHEALAVLLEDPAVQGVLARLFAELPDRARVLHVAAMLGRSEGLRVFLALPKSELDGLLTRLRWNGDLHAIERMLARYLPEDDRAAIQLDLAADVGSRISLELAFREFAPAVRSRQFAVALEQLEHDGACSPAKRAALLAWPGFARGNGSGAAVVREISHLKLECTGERLEAKAYFYFVPSAGPSQ